MVDLSPCAALALTLRRDVRRAGPCRYITVDNSVPTRQHFAYGLGVARAPFWQDSHTLGPRDTWGRGAGTRAATPAQRRVSSRYRSRAATLPPPARRARACSQFAPSTSSCARACGVVSAAVTVDAALASRRPGTSFQRVFRAATVRCWTACQRLTTPMAARERDIASVVNAHARVLCSQPFCIDRRYNYYIFSVPTAGSADITFSVTPMMGDPDM